MGNLEEVFPLWQSLSVPKTLNKRLAKRSKKPQAIVQADLLKLAQDANGFINAGTTEKTRRAYNRAWSTFKAWCVAQDLEALPAPPKVVGLYLSHLVAEEKKAATIDFAIVSISRAHQAAGFNPPTRDAIVREVRKGLRRKIGTAQDRKAPLLVEELRKVVEKLPSGIVGTRDKAVLLLGFAGAFRRSELVALDVEDLEFVSGGLRVMIRRSKTDQAGAGRTVAVPYGQFELTCPVKAVQRWLQEARLEKGPLLRGLSRGHNIRKNRMSDQSVALIVKKAVAAVGLDPARFAGHSLRAGLATSAAAAGSSDQTIMQTTGHKSRAVLDRYIREGRLFRQNAAREAGL